MEQDTLKKGSVMVAAGMVVTALAVAGVIVLSGSEAPTQPKPAQSAQQAAEPIEGQAADEHAAGTPAEKKDTPGMTSADSTSAETPADEHAAGTPAEDGGQTTAQASRMPDPVALEMGLTAGGEVLSVPGLSGMKRGLDAVPDSGAASGSGAVPDSGAVQQVGGTEYTWHDGDRVMSVWLQADLAVNSEGAVVERSAVGDGAGGAESAGADADSGGSPVFRSSSGALMTLPGGVLVAVDPDWTDDQVEAFFTANGISMDRVTEFENLPNVFLVATDPGFASLALANTLAGQDGVEISSPNWWTELALR